MSSITPQDARIESEQETLRRLDGVERAPLLPYAVLVAIAPGTSVEEPPYVFIEWTPDVIERPYPGSAVWRAALEQYLAHPRDEDPTYRALAPIVAVCLERFPSLDAWLRWADRERTVPDAPPEKRSSAWHAIVWPW